MEQARANWGAQADAYEKKVRDAVTSTDGEAILYGGVPILAVFHSSSAGLTRAAGQVWQNDLPYLKPVDSPEAKETIPNYYSRVDFTPGGAEGKAAGEDPLCRSLRGQEKLAERSYPGQRRQRGDGGGGERDGPGRYGARRTGAALRLL